MAMGLRYATQFGDGSPFVAPDAYERMLLNAARGDQALSVSAAELTEASGSQLDHTRRLGKLTHD